MKTLKVFAALLKDVPENYRCCGQVETVVEISTFG